MTLALEILTAVMLAAGCLFMFVGALGVLRLPDVFTRMHAAGITDTLAAGLILGGLCFQAGPTLISVKLLIIVAFILFTSPATSHALSRAALYDGLKPLLGDKATGDDPSREDRP